MIDLPARILVVDDDPSARDIVKRRLEVEGHDVLQAENGWQALDVIKETRPDLMILDMMMPGLDGIGVIKRVRADADMVSLPILMLTARDRAIDKQFGLEAGADDYLGKPFEFPELIGRVNALIRRARGWTVPQDTSKRGHVVTFVGAKGGVGTTTIAVNVAMALAKRGTSTILADLTSWGGSAAMLLGMTPRRRLDRLPLTNPDLFTPAMIENTLLAHASGLRLLAGRAREGGLVGDEVAHGLIEVIRRCADVVVLDVDEDPTAFTHAACRIASQTWIVTEPEPTSVERAASLVIQMDEGGIPGSRIGLVVNQTSPSMVMTASEIAAKVGIEPTHLLPAMPNACYAAAARGVPIIELAAQLPAAQAFAAFASAIAGHPATIDRVVSYESAATNP